MLEYFPQVVSDIYLQALINISDTFHAHKNFPTSRMPQKLLSVVDNGAVLSHETKDENVNGAELYGLGLKNEVGEYNCFLNVIIQVSLTSPSFSVTVSGNLTIYNVICGHLF